jgi:hypothetical protein
MNQNEEKLIKAFLNREILTGVDGGLRRAVASLYKAFQESSGLGEPTQPIKTKQDCYSFSETLGCRAEALGGKCGCKMLRDR